MVTVTSSQNETVSTAAADLVDQLKLSGALDELFARIDSGEVD